MLNWFFIGRQEDSFLVLLELPEGLESVRATDSQGWLPLHKAAISGAAKEQRVMTKILLQLFYCFFPAVEATIFGWQHENRSQVPNGLYWCLPFETNVLRVSWDISVFDSGETAAEIVNI